MLDKNVIIIGGGVTGLSTALALADFEINVLVVEKSDAPGGHAGRFTCKATDRCAHCGACIVEEKIRDALSHPKIEILTETLIQDVTQSDKYAVGLLDRKGVSSSFIADAVIIASGFQPFNPEKKPYGYGMFDNVITGLELETMLRLEDAVKRPSDNNRPGKIAFIQCVGSRDGKLNHLWCSRVCCASALRMAGLIKSKQPETDVTVFYMDVQTFGDNFDNCYKNIQKDLQMIRAIPGDIYETENNNLQVSHYNAGEDQTREDTFDMVVLSVAMVPGGDNKILSKKFDIRLDDTGFFSCTAPNSVEDNKGIYAAGTATGPMSIKDSVSDAERTAWEVINQLKAEADN